MPETPIRIEFEYTADDYVEGRRRSIGLSPKRANFSAWMALMIATAIGGPVIILNNPTDHGALVVGSIATGFGMWGLYAWLTSLWRFYFGGRREFPLVEVLQGNREMQFDEMGHTTRGPRYFSQLSWETYRGYLETPNLFLLSQPPGLYVTIPKRAFAPDQLPCFRELLSQKVPVVQPQPTTSRGFWIALAVAVSVLLILYVALRLFAKS